jgi:tetratricopeptide (TPR) repeat protein
MAFRNSHAKACLSAIILVSPIIIGLDPSYTAFLWILLLAPILTPIELRIAACCIAIQIIHPCILLAENHFSVKESPLSIVSLQKQPQLISLNARGLEKLSQHDQLFMVGWEALHSNDWERAENIFRTLSALPHESCATLNNLGVALHRQQKTHDAKAAFVKARNANSGAIEPIYNQAIIDFAALDYVEGEKKLLEAKKINLQEYNRITNSMMFFNRQPTFAMPIPDTHERINALTHSYNNFYNGSFDMMNINNQSNTSFIWIIWPLLGATAIVLRRFKSGALYRPFLCNNCGEIVWETPHFGQNICHQCQSLQASKGASHISGRTKKLRQIHKFKVFQRRITWLFRAILPGCDRILHGSTLVGFGILLVTVTAAGLIFQSPNNTLYPSETIPDPPSTFMVIGGLLAFIMYLQSWLKPRSNR